MQLLKEPGIMCRHADYWNRGKRGYLLNTTFEISTEPHDNVSNHLFKNSQALFPLTINK